MQDAPRNTVIAHLHPRRPRNLCGLTEGAARGEIRRLQGELNDGHGFPAPCVELQPRRPSAFNDLPAGPGAPAEPVSTGDGPWCAPVYDDPAGRPFCIGWGHPSREALAVFVADCLGRRTSSQTRSVAAQPIALTCRRCRWMTAGERRSQCRRSVHAGNLARHEDQSAPSGPRSTRHQVRGRSVHEGSTDAVAGSLLPGCLLSGASRQPRSAAPSSAHVGLSPTCLFHPTRMREVCNATGTGRPDPAVRSASSVFQPVLHVPRCGGGRRSTLIGRALRRPRRPCEVRRKTVLDAIHDRRWPKA